MPFQPVGELLRAICGQHIQDPAALEIHHDRPVCQAFSPREFVHSNHHRSGMAEGLGALKSNQGIAADFEAKQAGHTGGMFGAAGMGELKQDLLPAFRVPLVARKDAIESFSERGAAAGG